MQYFIHILKQSVLFMVMVVNELILIHHTGITRKTAVIIAPILSYIDILKCTIRIQGIIYVCICLAAVRTPH